MPYVATGLFSSFELNAHIDGISLTADEESKRVPKHWMRSVRETAKFRQTVKNHRERSTSRAMTIRELKLELLTRHIASHSTSLHLLYDHRPPPGWGETGPLTVSPRVRARRVGAAQTRAGGG